MKKDKITAKELNQLVKNGLNTVIFDDNAKEPLIGVFLNDILLTTIFVKDDNLVITDCKKFRIKFKDFKDVSSPKKK